jgi:hypothetical protein
MMPRVDDNYDDTPTFFEPKLELEKEQTTPATETAGRKFDGGKLEYGLIPPKALEATVGCSDFWCSKV